MRRRFMISSLAAGLVLSTIALPAAAQDGAFTLTVLHSNDGESDLLPDDYEFTGEEDLVDLACPTGTPAVPFADVAEGSTHAAAIACGVASDVIEGRSSTSFAPAMDVTRGQMASLLLRVLLDAGIEVPAASAGPNFSDLDPTHGDATRRLAAAGIVQGYQDDSFRPYASIRRDQMASLLVRALAHARGEAITPSEDAENFDDVDGGVHADNIAAAAELGLLRGQVDGTFGPLRVTRRDQAATVVVRLIGRITGETVPAGGVSRFVGLVKALQEEGTGENAGVVTLSSGDNFLAGPEHTASVESYEAGGLYYDAEVFKEAGYDAMTIGNHEFDFGPEGLAQFIEAFDGGTPFLSANLDISGEAALDPVADQIAPSAIVDAGGVDVGIIGATTEDLESVSSPGDVIVNDVLPAVQDAVADLEAAGVEHIVLSSHLQNLDNERDLIAGLSGVDAVVGGGGAEDLSDNYPFLVEDADGNEVPLVTTPGSYRDVGKLVLEFDAEGDLVGVGDGSALVPVPAYGAQDAETLANVEEPVADAVAALDEVIVATSEVDLDGRTAIVRTRESNLGDLMSDGLLEAARRLAGEYSVPEADVALQNGGGIRGDAIVPAGDISVLDTFNVAPFGNVVSVVEDLTPEELRALIEHGISDLPAVEGKFGQWAGVEFNYDISQDPGSRIVNAVVTRADGTEVDLVVNGVTNVAAGTFTLAGLNFTLNCGDAYPFPGCEEGGAGADFTTLGAYTDQRALQDHLEDELGGTVSAAQYPELTTDGADTYRRFGPADEFDVDPVIAP